MDTSLTLSRREQAQRLNFGAEKLIGSLCVLLAEFEESKEYEEWGFDTFHEYAQSELGKSKPTVSRLTKVGRLLRSSGQELPDGTSVTRMYYAMNLLPEASFEEIAAHAQTLSESEIIGAKQAKDAGEHACIAVCKHCKRLM